jgi:hypothetical protein
MSAVQLAIAASACLWDCIYYPICLPVAVQQGWIQPYTGGEVQVTWICCRRCVLLHVCCVAGQLCFSLFVGMYQPSRQPMAVNEARIQPHTGVK